MTEKSVLMRPQGLRSGSRAPPGVARGYPAPWGKNILGPYQQALQNLK